jgi:FixJ family two-component response regulator
MGVSMSKVNAASAADPVVYIIDDDDGMRRALSLLLTTVGYKTAAFANPTDFLAQFKSDAAGCLA